MKKIFLFLIFTILISSCSINFQGNEKRLKVGTWNVQTFFDSTNEGTEYSEFRKGDNWNQSKYEERLDRLCQVINEMDCDVIVLEELENEGVIYDINNRLAGNAWNPKKCWKYSCFAKNKGDAIGCGVLSKYELSNLKIHNLDIQIEKDTQPSMRPIMEMTVNLGTTDYVLFVNHWKSKLGGQETTEIWRDYQENLLGYLTEEAEIQNKAFIACGDFNRDIQDFSFSNEAENKMVEIRPGNFGNKGTFVKSVWFSHGEEDFEGRGSYYYKDSWERIDHIFVSKGFFIKAFELFSKGPWCYEDGVPKEYKIYSGEGYSDHVPLMVELEVTEEL